LRILVSGVNYAPEVTGIGPYTTGLAEHLAMQGHEVIVATTFPFAPLWRWFEPPPRWRTRERLNGVDVWRTKVVLPPRRTAVWRVVFDSSIGLTSALTALSIPRVDVTICLSPPIQTTLTAAAVRFKLGKLVVLVKDLPTEAARSVGMLKEGAALRVGRSLENLAYKLADHIVVISSAFATYIQSAGVEAAKISVIPDWADVESIRPGRADQEVRRRLGACPGDFLVVHTGNMGAKQDLLNVVAAAALLKEDKYIKIVLIGDGQERSKVAQDIAARHLDNIRLLPLQASHEFSAVLAAADALLLNQAAMIIDSVLPSKLLAYMASGRTVVAAAHPNSTTADLIRRAGCGVVADPGQPEALATEILSLASADDSHQNSSAMGLRGRAYVEKHFERRSIMARWDELLARLGTRGGLPLPIVTRSGAGSSGPD
jgi:glycosyltransferase involved in cell wall biosynthesis